MSDDKKASAEDAASALDGTEIVRAVQGGNSVRTTTAAIAHLSVPVVTAVSGTSHNLAATEAGAYLRFTNSAAKTLTVRPDSTEALGANSEFHGRNVGAGALTITAGSGVTIHAPAGGSLVVPQNGTYTLKRVTTDEFDLIGLTSP